MQRKILNQRSSLLSLIGISNRANNIRVALLLYLFSRLVINGGRSNGSKEKESI